MSTPSKQEQSGPEAAQSKIKKVLELVAMKSPMHITKGNNRLSKGLVMKMLGGLALGGILVATTGLTMGITSTNEPNSSPVIENIIIDERADNLAGDEVRGTGLELQGPPLDAWMHDSPFYQDFAEAGRTEVRGTGLELQGPPLDAWMHDSPFYQDFAEVSRIGVGTAALEAQGPPLDAWMHDSPFYQDFAEAGRTEVRGTGLELQGPPLDAWMHDSPFYQDFAEAGR